MEWFSIISDLEGYRDGGLPLFDAILRLGVAMLLGIAIGFERAHREHPAGMRTYAVVSMASALMMIVSIYGMPMHEGQPQDPGRIAAQVVSGIGFLGAGVIFMRRNIVRGLTTAASLWAVSGIGLAVGGGMIVTGTVAAIFLLLISGGLYPVKQRLFHNDDEHEHKVRLYLTSAVGIVGKVKTLAHGEPGFTVTSLKFDSSPDKRTSELELRLKVNDPDDAIRIVKDLEALPGVTRIGWQFGSLE